MLRKPPDGIACVEPIMEHTSRAHGSMVLKSVLRIDNHAFAPTVNRKKHDVIGQKVRGERGHVVKSRTIATERRRRTLLPQLQQKDKVNAFVDRRFGENDANMTLEEKMLLRFAVERKVG